MDGKTLVRYRRHIGSTQTISAHQKIEVLERASARMEDDRLCNHRKKNIENRTHPVPGSMPTKLVKPKISGSLSIHIFQHRIGTLFQ